MPRKATTSFTADLPLLDRLDHVVESFPRLTRSELIREGLEIVLAKREREIEKQQKVGGRMVGSGRVEILAKRP